MSSRMYKDADSDCEVRILYPTLPDKTRLGHLQERLERIVLGERRFPLPKG